MCKNDSIDYIYPECTLSHVGLQNKIHVEKSPPNGADIFEDLTRINPPQLEWILFCRAAVDLPHVNIHEHGTNKHYNSPCKKQDLLQWSCVSEDSDTKLYKMT